MAIAKSFVAVQLPADPAASNQASNRNYVDTGLATKVPTTRTVTASTGLTGGGVLSADIALSVAYGTTSTTACVGNDGRLSDARTPTTHKSSHATGGSDALSPVDIGAEKKLVPTGNKTAAYTAVDTDLVMVDATSGGITITAPAAAAGREFAVKKVDSSTNIVTVARAGSDTIGATAATSVQIKLQDQAIAFAANGTNWVISENNLGLANLDARFQALDSDLTTIAGLTPGSGNVLAADGSGWVSKTYAALKTALGLTKSDVGLGNVDNTSDATKNSASATLTNKTLTSPVINSPTGIVKGDVGLGNVDNTSDATKNSATATLTNKRITKRVGSTTSTATLTYDSDSYDQYNLTAQAAALSIANPSGTPTDGQQLMIRIKDNATARAITWSGTQWRALGAALPTTTVISKTLYIGAVWNAADSKWDVLAVGQEA